MGIFAMPRRDIIVLSIFAVLLSGLFALAIGYLSLRRTGF